MNTDNNLIRFSMPARRRQAGWLLKLLLLLVTVVSLASCQKDERMFKKFVSRYNAKEFDASSAYIYNGDLTQLAFFTQEVKKKEPDAFIKIEECDYNSDTRTLDVTLRWENAGKLLTSYLKGIGHPVAPDGTMHEKIKVVETTDGDRLAFNWGLPRTDDSKLMMAGVHSDNEEITAVNIRATPGGDVVGVLSKGDRILADENGLDDGCYPVYWVDSEGSVNKGYMKASLLNLSSSTFFHLGILDSMGLFVVLIIAVVVLLPLFLLRALFLNPFLAVVGIGLLLFCLYIFYQCIEKILFELFIINLPY